MEHKRRKAFRQRITIQQRVQARDSSGQLVTSEWQDVANLTNLHAFWNHTAGTETFRGQQLQSTVVGVFEVRKPPVAISTKYRVMWDGSPYGIVSVRPAETQMDGGFRFEYIMVEAFGD